MNAKLQSENGENHIKLENGNHHEEWKIVLDRKTSELRSELKESKNELRSEIDGNFFANTDRINELTEKCGNFFKMASNNSKNDSFVELENQIKILRELIAQPLSVYFCANRSEDFVSGGENFLTFDSKSFICNIRVGKKGALELLRKSIGEGTEVGRTPLIHFQKLTRI